MVAVLEVDIPHLNQRLANPDAICDNLHLVLTRNLPKKKLRKNLNGNHLLIQKKWIMMKK